MENSKRVWKQVGSIGEMRDGNGSSLTYGDFGSGTYGLYTNVDGNEVTLMAYSKGDASETLDKLGSGWRPANWQGALASLA